MDWIYSLLDFSRVATFFISIILIVYGSLRSINLDQDTNNEDKETVAGSTGVSSSGKECTNENNPSDNSNIQTIDTLQAILLPLGASISLLMMFFFFDSLQLFFAIAIASLATMAFAFLLLPVCQCVMKPFSNGQRIAMGVLGRHTPAEIASFFAALCLVFIWILTGHWLLMDALAMGLCVAMIAYVRLPSLKVSTLLLIGLLIYDVFWVFFSTYLFNVNVMVKVATRPADNPVGFMAKKLNVANMVMQDSPKLSLPGKLIFPSMKANGHFSMLGLGDIVMPGLLLCFVLRFDNYKKRMNAENNTLLQSSSAIQKITYFHCSLIGYLFGLITATLASELSNTAQPALLYLVPFTLLPLSLMAYLKGDLKRMWNEPFQAKSQPSKCLDV